MCINIFHFQSKDLTAIAIALERERERERERELCKKDKKEDEASIQFPSFPFVQPITRGTKLFV